jgi:DNA polymerase IV
MDEFFAAVEKLDRPELRGKCLLVGGDPKARGVVSTASYEARAFGCGSAMPMSIALRRCPHAIVLPVRGERYRELSDRVFTILEEFTPIVEPLSIDEAFLDVTGCERLFGPADQMAREVKDRVLRQTGLTASVGLAPNKFLAKLASDLDKPDGLTVITEADLQSVLDPLPIRKLWGIGPAAERRLQRLNVHTVGQLRNASADLIRRELGEMGEHIQELARGEDERPVTPDTKARSISQETTFAEDLAGHDALKAVLLNQVEQVARRLRRSGFRARTMTLKLRYGDFTTVTRSATSPEPTDVTELLWREAAKAFDAWWAASRRPLRLLGFAVTQLVSKQGGQLSLFADEGQGKRRRLDEAMDRIEDRFGAQAISRAASQKRRKG